MSIRQTASNATRAAIFRIAAGFCLALLALHPPEALQAQPLTLDNVLSRAIQHPDVAVAEAEINAAIGSKVAADRAPLPTVSTSIASIDLQNGLGPGSLLGGKRFDTGVGVDWTWERGDKRAHRTRSAEFALAASRFERTEALIRRQIAISGAFWDLLAAQEREIDSEQMLRSAEQIAELARRRLEKGDISEQELARVVIETERARGDDALLRAARQLAAVTLAQAAALSGDRPVAAAGWPALPTLAVHDANLRST